MWRTINKSRLKSAKNQVYKNYKLTSYIFRPSSGHLQAGYLKHIRKHIDHVRKTDLASQKILSQIWVLNIADFKIKFEH
jgi:hypothetical protein